MKVIPELLETEIGESIVARTRALGGFKELGPPDLVHLTKDKNSRDHGCYHYVSGVDASSSASVAAYLNTLTFTLGEAQIWFSNKAQWRVHSGQFCVFNAFTGLDLRVAVRIPGSVETFAVDDKGEKHVPDEQMWVEAYMSGMLRSLLFSDGEDNYVSACRRLSPLSSPDSVTKFYDSFQRLFGHGIKLGSVPEVQVATPTNNYLIDGFLEFTRLTGAFDKALQVLDWLAKVTNVNVLKAKVLLMASRETEAVKLIYEAVTKNPRDSDMLQLESEFCRQKGRLDLARPCAVGAVESNPAGYLPWDELVRVYIQQEEYELALLALNSCPMFVFREPDVHRNMPQPLKVHFPMPPDGSLDEVWSLEYGSTVGTGPNAIITEQPNGNGNANGSAEKDSSSSEAELARLPAGMLKSTFLKAYDLLTEIVAKIGWDTLLRKRSVIFVMEGEFQREEEEVISRPPVSAKEKDEDQTQNQPQKVPDSDDIRNKRLCERWLDNLFMVLYHDLKVYTVWRAEYVQHMSQQQPYHKTAREWELLGTTAFRLHHYPEAVDAWMKALDMRFSYRIMWKLLDLYDRFDLYTVTDTGLPGYHVKVQSTLDTVVKLTAWNHRWYNDFSPALTRALRRLVATEGYVKVRSLIEAKYSPQQIVPLMDQSLAVLKALGADGSDD